MTECLYAKQRGSTPPRYARVFLTMTPVGLVVKINSDWGDLVEDPPIGAVIIGDFYQSEDGENLLSLYRGMGRHVVWQQGRPV